jgi:hypothetical protein
VKRPRITKSEAAVIAKAEAEQRGWPWTEPVAVKVGGTLPPSRCGWRHWIVTTNASVQRPTPRSSFDVSFDGRNVMAHWIGRTAPPNWPTSEKAP